MRLYAFLIIAAYARAASIPALDVKDIQKKLATVAQEAASQDVIPLVPVENTSSEQELVDQANAINEVENNLRKGVNTADIPVKVVVEEIQPQLKINNEKPDEEVKLDEAADIKRVEIDLKNPGEPQRQEHETQNPEYYEQPIPVTIKKIVVDTQATLKQGFEGLGQGIAENWFSNNQQIGNFQQSLQDLQNNFISQLEKLNSTLSGLVNTGQSTVAAGQKDGIEKVQDGLRTLENNFQAGVRTLTNGVQDIATVRAEGETSTNGTTTSTGDSTGSTNPFVSYLQLLQNTLTQGFANVTATIQNTFNQNGSNNTIVGPGNFISSLGSGFQNIIGGGSTTTAAGAQSDEAVTTSRPGLVIWQGIQNSIQNLWNPGQNQSSQTSQPGPIAQAIQNNPIVQGVVNLIQPNRPGAQTPAAATEKPAESTQQEGSNDVPAANTNEAKPEQSSDEKTPEVTDGPIKKIIQNNPIVKGISGAVQKIQSLSNPEKPRDALEGEETDADGKGHHGHGDRPANSGDNNSNNVKVENVPEKIEEQEHNVPAEEPKKEAEQDEQTQPEPEATANKTE